MNKEQQMNLKELAKETLFEIRKIVTNQETSKSDKIRRLYELKLNKATIAKILNIKYQFVYQVLNKKEGGIKNKNMSNEEILNFLNELE